MYSLWKRFLFWTILLMVSALWHQQCGFSDWDLRASTLSCLLLKSSTSRSHNDGKLTKEPVVVDECNIIHSYCISPSQIQFLGPRIISDILALGGPAWIWLPLLYVFFKGIQNPSSPIRRGSRTTLDNVIDYIPSPTPTISDNGSSNDGAISTTTRPATRNPVSSPEHPPSSSLSLVSSSSSVSSESLRILTIVFTVLRIVLIYTMYMYLIFIMIIRFTVKFVDYFGGWDPSGHVFLYGLQLLPLWLLPTVDHSSTTNPSRHSTDTSVLEHIYYHPSSFSSYPLRRPLIPGTFVSLYHILTVMEMVIYYMTFTTASFFHTPSETFASWLIITLFMIGLRYIIEQTLVELRQIKDLPTMVRTINSRHNPNGTTHHNGHPPPSPSSGPIALSTSTVQNIDNGYGIVILWYIFTVILCYIYIAQPSHRLSSSSSSSLTVSSTSSTMFGAYLVYDTLVILTLHYLRKAGKRIVQDD